MCAPLSRRTLIQLAGIAVARVARAAPAPVSLFDGKTLDGWLQIENSATAFSSGGIADAAALFSKLAGSADAVSAFLRAQLPADATTVPNLVKALNQIVNGPSIYDSARFAGIVLRPETAQLARQNPAGYQLARLNKLLLEDAYPVELARSA